MKIIESFKEVIKNMMGIRRNSKPMHITNIMELELFLKVSLLNLYYTGLQFINF